MTMGNNIFQDVFEQDPLGRQSLFLGFAPPNLNQNQFQSFSQLFEPSFNRYLGLLGNDVRVGRTPSTSFTDHLMNQDFGRQFRRSQADRTQTSRFTSPTRFFFTGG